MTDQTTTTTPPTVLTSKEYISKVRTLLEASGKPIITRAELVEAGHTFGLPANREISLVKGFTGVPGQRGSYFVTGQPTRSSAPSPAPGPKASPAQLEISRNVESVKAEDCYIPEKDPTFVSWGEAKNLEKIIDSHMFFPIYIAGLSGNGKTFMVEQACANRKRSYIRIQITPETDEDDLMGGFRLIDGDTVFAKGPVIKAMEEGAIILIDEIDRGSNKIMCLQGVLEGKPVLLKKTGETIYPAPGFNVIATANTKGRGSDDGRFSAATIIDDAFLERFVSMINQQWPTCGVEKRILTKHMEALDPSSIDHDFIEKLTTWASIIRKTFDEDAIDDVISTRRLCHIIRSWSIFNCRLTAIKMCIGRFEDDTSQAFLDLYTKVDNGHLEAEPENAVDAMITSSIGANQ